MRMTKWSSLFLLLLSCKISVLIAQAPQKMSYQAVLRNSASELVVNTIVGMRISIIQSSETGTEVYAEVQKPKTNANGLVTIAIGTGTVVRGVFSAINWGEGPYFIKTETDPYGGASYTITGVSQFMSVPYALFAANSGSSAGVAGKSAFEIWKEQPGNSGKTEKDFLTALHGTNGKSAFEVWVALAGNSAKTEADFFEAIRGVSGKDGVNGAAGVKGADGLPGMKGESVYDIWRKEPANAGKTEADFLQTIKAVKGDKGDAGEKGDTGEKGTKGDPGEKGADGLPGMKGESVYDIWRKDPANAGKTEVDFLQTIKAVKGDKGDAGEKGTKGDPGEKGADGLPGMKGESVYDIWQKDPANVGKTEADFLQTIKAVKGDKGDAGEKGTKGDPGEKGADGLPGMKGESVYDIWQKDPANAGKTEAEFLEGIKGLKGDTGANGKSAFELWKEKLGNTEKTEDEYEASLKGLNGKTILSGTTDPALEQGNTGDFFINTETLTFFGPKASDGTWPVGSVLKGTSGIGLDFKGSYTDLKGYKDAGNPEELNKAYYNTTLKKSFLYDGKEWQVFAQDGTGTGSGGLDFNVDRNITRALLPGAGTNLGAGKTTAQFLEDYFFPRLSATAPAAELAGTSLDIPYKTWKDYNGLATMLNLTYKVTNKSKQDDTEDKNISSIRLLSGSTEIATAVVNNTVNPQTGTFSAVPFVNTSGSKTADFSKTFQMEVKDEQPNTATSNAVTAYMRKAVRLTLTTPAITPSQQTYEYGTADIPVTLSWTFNTGDETVKDITVQGVSTGSKTTVTKNVVFKAVANQGTQSQSFPVVITGDIYGATSATSPTIKWESTLYRGVYTSSMAPNEDGFSISDNQINKGNQTLLGGTWKNSVGYDFECNATGQYVFFAYPDDGATPVTVEYFDKNFGWQSYPANQIKEISRVDFVNASGYKGTKYKLVFVCVEYKSATVKIRIN